MDGVGNNKSQLNVPIVSSSQNPQTPLGNARVEDLFGEANHASEGVLSDQFGLLALRAYMREVHDDPVDVRLAIGEDLTRLGLSVLDQEQDVCTTFGGPWATRPCRARDLDAEVPFEYLTNAALRNRLPNIRLTRMSEDVLFYIFYNFTGEVYQVAAAHELYNRGWRYHMSLRMWLARSHQDDLKERTTSFEIGFYNVFDPGEWRKVRKELKLEYNQLEGRPRLPGSLIQPAGDQCAQVNAGDTSTGNS